MRSPVGSLDQRLGSVGYSPNIIMFHFEVGYDLLAIDRKFQLLSIREVRVVREHARD